MIIRLSILACFIYFIIILILEGTLAAVAHLKGGAAIVTTKTGWVLILSLCWFVSLLVAWHFAGPNRLMTRAGRSPF